VRAPLFYFAVIGSAWLATLGACGRTAPLVEDTYGYAAAAADEGDETGGSRTGGTSGSSNGGSRTGGTSSGGTSNGGSAASPSAGGTGGTDIDDGGATFSGGTAGTIAAGGTEPAGGAFSTGGTSTSVGGSGNTGGTDGGTSAGGSSPMTGGTGNETGGTGGAMMMTGGVGGTAGMGGMTTLPPGFIRCGDTACDSEVSICCQRRSSPSTCEEPGTNCMGATLTCSGANSCDPGELCCYHARQSSCQQSCEVSVGSPGNSPTIILCDSSEECGADETCVFAPRGVAYCGDNL
jgi:hypothetical protein